MKFGNPGFEQVQLWEALDFFLEMFLSSIFDLSRKNAPTDLYSQNCVGNIFNDPPANMHLHMR